MERTIRRRIHRRSAKLAACGAGVSSAAVLGLATVANASPPADPTDGAAGDLSSGVTDWVTTYGLPALVAVLILGVIVTLMIKYGRKMGQAAG